MFSQHLTSVNGKEFDHKKSVEKCYHPGLSWNFSGLMIVYSLLTRKVIWLTGLKQTKKQKER